MRISLAGNFTNNLAKLTGDKKKAVKAIVIDLQMNPANPGMKFHRLEYVKKNAPEVLNQVAF